MGKIPGIIHGTDDGRGRGKTAGRRNVITGVMAYLQLGMVDVAVLRFRGRIYIN